MTNIKRIIKLKLDDVYSILFLDINNDNNTDIFEVQNKVKII